MIQPFEMFTDVYLRQLLKMSRVYVVTQTYTRAVNHIVDEGRIAILLTDYDDKGGALIHYNAVRRNDPFGYLLDLSKPAHLTKLEEMLSGDKYRLYWAVVKSVPDLVRRIDLHFKDRMRRYINQHTDWRIRGDESVSSTLEIIFGEIFITLKWKAKKLRIKFEEIERA